MDNESKVSVTIPVYNSDRYINECIDSLSCQTYPNIEDVAVDDESNDTSLSILRVMGMR